MNLIQRYVHAVKTYLPEKIRDDVGEELQQLLEEKLNDIREEKGREPSNQDLSEFLKRQGHPMKMAASYQEPSSLVSESLFPFYKECIKWLMILLLALKAASWALAIIIQKNGIPIKELIVDSINTLALGFAYATIAFHLWGKTIEHQQWYKNWEPEKLPNIVSDGSQQSRGESIFTLILNLCFLGLINDVTPFHSQSISITASPEFAALLPWANALILMCLASDIEKIFRPVHTFASTRVALILSVTALLFFAYIATLDASLQIRLGNHEFNPIKNYFWVIGILVIAATETRPISKRFWLMWNRQR